MEQNVVNNTKKHTPLSVCIVDNIISMET